MVDERYSGTIYVVDSGRNIMTSLEEIEAAIQEAYDAGEDFYDVSYSFYNTSMPRTEAVAALEAIIPYDIIENIGYMQATYEYLVEITLQFKQ